MLSLLEGHSTNDPDNIVIIRHDFQNKKFTRMASKMSTNKRFGCAAVVVNNNNTNDNPRRHQQNQRNKVLVFGGAANKIDTDIVESYDSNNNLNQQQQWRQLGRRMPMALTGLAAVNLPDNNDVDKVYLFGGHNADDDRTQKRCYEYDVSSDTYKNMPPMIQKRGMLTSAITKNKYLFAIGGRVGGRYGNALDTVEYFDTTTSVDNNAEWRILKAKMNKKRWGCCSAIVGNALYVIGGMHDSIEMYDTSKENSRFVLLDAKMKNKRCGASAVVLGYHILIIGGGEDENDEVFNSIEIFNTKTQEFVDCDKYALPTMTRPRYFFFAVLVGNTNNNDNNNNNDTLGMNTNSKKILVGGGIDGGPSRTAEVIDIKTTAIPISKFCFTKSKKSHCLDCLRCFMTCKDKKNNDEYDDGKLPSDINKIILSFLISEPETKNN